MLKRNTGRMLDWGTGDNEMESNHPGMDGVDCEFGYTEKYFETGEPDVLRENGLMFFSQEASSATPLPVPDGYYHFIRANCSFDQINCDIGEACSEMKRILAPRGTILITDNTYYGDEGNAEDTVKEYKEWLETTIKVNFPDDQYYCNITYRQDIEDCVLFYTVVISSTI